MTFDFATAKANARRTVQATFGVPALYSDNAVSELPIRARLHLAISKPFGDLTDGAGYAQVVDGTDQIVFDGIDEAGDPFTPVRNATVTFPSVPGETFRLDHRVPTTGPVTSVWQVVRV